MANATIHHSKTATLSITPNARIENERGAWAELRFDPQGGYVPGLGPQGVWYVRAYAADFRVGIESHELTSNRDRARAERAMRNWLAKR